MTTKRGMMVTYLDELLPIKSHGPFITWPCKMTNDPLNVKLQDKLKSLHFHYHSAYGHKIWQAADFP